MEKDVRHKWGIVLKVIVQMVELLYNIAYGIYILMAR